MGGGAKRVGFLSGFLGGQGLPAAVLIGAEWVGLQVSTPTSTSTVPLKSILCSRNLPESIKITGFLLPLAACQVNPGDQEMVDILQ